MQKLTQAGLNIVNNISTRYGISQDAVIYMLVAVNNGGGSMAQFNCPELGGGGQWMRGGMTMVGDMFNNGLKMTVDNLCSELSNSLANTQMFPPMPTGVSGSNHWWPASLGVPFSSGSQNNTRYAVFPNRIAIELHGQVTIYDSLNHNVGGVSQQQGGDNSLTFSSQFGTIAVNSLPIISGTSIAEPSIAPAPQSNFAQIVPISSNTVFAQTPQTQQNADMAISAATNSQSPIELIELIGKLAQLRDAGALSEDEFNVKKIELLRRV